MKATWFKMYRSIIDWEWFKEHDMTCFFIYCLSKANLQDRIWRGRLVKRGELIVSRSTVCRELGIEERRYRTIVNRLSKSGEISVDTTGGNTLITINNWDSYQAEYFEECESIRPATDQQQTRQRPSIESFDNRVINEKTDIKEERDIDGPTKSDQPSPPTIDLFFHDEDDDGTKPQAKKSKTEVDCAFVVKLYHDRCPDLPKIIKITDKRKTRLRLWFEDVGRTYEKVQEIFDRVQSSRFLRGDNSRGWKADLDWIINSTNWVKILEGKYDDKETLTNYPTNETQQTDRFAKRRGADSEARCPEDYSDTF